MILYKYMNYENFEKFLDSGCIVFSSADSFNDINEITNYFSKSLRNTNDNEFEQYFKPIVNISNSVILCLTRNPLNTLMWAHYANSHKGVVIGIDVSETDMIRFEYNILPAQFGSVIYTKTYPSSNTIAKEESSNSYAQLIGFNLENMEILQRRYLYKSIEWSYEEEVRVVKHRNYSNFKKSEYYSNHLLMELPNNSVVEIYFGSSLIDQVKRKTYESLKSKYEKLVFKQCILNFDDWHLSSTTLTEDDFITNDDEWAPIKISSIYLFKMRIKETFKSILNKIGFNCGK